MRLGLAAFGIYLAVWVGVWAWRLLVHPEWAQLDQSGMDPNFSHITAILVETNSVASWRVALTTVGLKPQTVDGVTIYRIPSPSAIHLTPARHRT